MLALRVMLLGAMATWVLAGGPALANGAPPPSADTKAAPINNLTGVTMTAPKSSPSVRTASEFVRYRLPESPLTGQYPRYAEPVCVRVQGLPMPFNAYIAQRIVKLAAKLDKPLAKAANCVLNVQVIFTAEPQKLLSNIARKRAPLLGYPYRSQFKCLATFSRPVQSWYVTYTRGTTGGGSFDLAHGARSDIDPRDAQFGGGTGLGGFGPHGRAGSRLGADMSSDIAFSLILGDATTVAYGKIGPPADYIAVLALARWPDLEHFNAVIPTILNPMAEACLEAPPEAVTPPTSSC
jgi:hypothetical protein